MIDLSSPTKHAGVLIPLDPFRVSHLAATAAELLVSKARNITDAKLVLTRHPQAQLVIGRIEGSVVEGDPPTFWRQNADIAMAMSQVVPRQLFMYYVQSAPPEERREGFVVAQRGQVLAADESSAESQTEGAEVWAVEQLCSQLRLDPAELASGFEGGPSVEISLLEPNVDDQAMLMTLAGQPPEGDPGEGAEDGPTQAAPPPGGPAGPGGPGPAQGQPQAPAKPKLSVADDIKRREKERADEVEEQRRRADEVKSDLPFLVDDLGIVVCPKAELSEPDIIDPLIVGKISGDLPPGLPGKLTEDLQGKRCDVALRVDFYSEVFLDSTPLSRPAMEERAETRTIGGKEIRVIEALAPRLGYGTFLTTGKAPHVFVSRKPDLALPEDLILDLLG
ncbi:MAG: hypothetical protein AAF799_42680 [Myxococcota bacterium]